MRKVDLHAMYLKILPKEDPTVIVDHLFRIFDRDNSGMYLGAIQKSRLIFG